MEENKNLEEQNSEITQVEETTQAGEVEATAQNNEEVAIVETAEENQEQVVENAENSGEMSEEETQNEDVEAQSFDESVKNDTTKEKPKKVKKVKVQKQKVEKPKKEKLQKPAKKTKAQVLAEKQAEREAEFASLSDDEKYVKIQTEKLLKRKKKNKIVTLVSLCFAFVLAVSVIVMAAVPVSLKPKCIDSGFSRVQIYPGTTTTNINCYKDTDRFEKFMEVYDEAFSQPYITALFSGTLFSYDIEEKWSNVPTVDNLTNNDTYIVHLTYSQNQILTNQNGKVYKSNYWVEKWPDTKLTFTDVWFELSKNEGMQETTVYIAINNYPKFSDGEFSGYKTEGNLVKITVKGNTKLIYDACDEIKSLS